MKAQTYTDTEVIAAIKSGGPKRQKVIRFLYKDASLKSKIIQFVSRNSGNYQDGEDMFHEGIIVLDRNIRQNKFKEETSLQGYLYSICRFLWMNQIRKQGKVTLVEDNKDMDSTEMDTPEVVLFNSEQKEILNSLVKKLGARCQKILELWKLSYSMEEIAQQLGFSSAAMARKNKYRCHKSLLEIIEKHPQLVKTLKEH